ncbi:hydroxyisourate hydrolase [Haloferula luteola]|uniref:5-hydroxyisourate hydrolase n=1 Tax=Haloferula luteola TaxID=595692 RepID=A0A840V0L9_9BACT|nr:hydroxyisourate hydrolase [Haloferula luteola]MBB5351535.1 hydroxyisourate hydrolase [Haloferula luteola]
MSKISTHALDLTRGRPAAGLGVRLLHQGKLLTEITTNADGRSEAPLALDPATGDYQIEFSVGPYYRQLGIDSPFLETVPIAFRVTAGESYHIPLSFTPWAYSTYRGS